MPGLLCAKYLDQGRSTFWILPLLSMHEQYLLRCKNYGMTCETWSPRTSVTNPPTNILVTIEQTQGAAFHEYVHKMHSAGSRIARVIVDEAHLTLTHKSFRPVMAALEWLGQQDIQLVLQTATMPPSLEEQLFNAFGVSVYVVCRSKTPRPNISYQVVRCQSEEKLSTLKREYEKAKGLSPTNKVMVFCLRKADAEMAAKWLGIRFCHAEMSQDAVSELLGEFRTGVVKAIACTSLLGVALDVSGVSHVFHLDYPRDVLSFAQETGRLGREGDLPKVWSIVIAPRGQPKRITKEDLFGAKIIRESIDDTVKCRRLLLQTFLDGSAEPCSMMEGTSHFCDNCERLSLILPDRGNGTVNVKPPPAIAPFSLQLATKHSVLISPPNIPREPHSDKLEVIKNSLDILANSCVACWLFQANPSHGHLFKHCTALSPHPYTLGDWRHWRSLVSFPENHCYGCGCPHEVSVPLFQFL
jgi:Helicase conserved C-terminal domain